MNNYALILRHVGDDGTADYEVPTQVVTLVANSPLEAYRMSSFLVHQALWREFMAESLFDLTNGECLDHCTGSPDFDEAWDSGMTPQQLAEIGSAAWGES